MNFRGYLFKIFQFFAGREILKDYKRIKDHFSDKKDNSESLSKLLYHAKSSTNYYSSFDATSLNSFPVNSKVIIKSNFESFLSVKFRDKRLIRMTTSGSTGTPFTVFQDRQKKIRNYSDTLFFSELGGFNLGNRLLYFKIWAKQKMQSPFRYWLQNIVPVDVLYLNETEIETLLQGLKKKSSQMHSVLGYVSALEQIIRYCEKNKITDLGVKFSGVITMSEGLSPETRQKLRELFKCQVVSRYSNLENGIIAQQEISSDNFLVNTASYILEIFHPERDEAVEDGFIGRIVVTDLYNYAMPMIRYDTGDFGVREIKNGKVYLKTIEGRKLDLLFDTQGNLVSSYIMYKNMWQYTELDQYQLVQTGERSYEFKINCPKGFTREMQLVEEFKTYLGADADFKVIYVNEIPLLDSGKRRKTVNLYKNIV